MARPRRVAQTKDGRRLVFVKTPDGNDVLLPVPSDTLPGSRLVTTKHPVTGEWFLVAEPPDLEGPLEVSSVDPVVPFAPPPINKIPSYELPTQITESAMVDAIASPSQTPTGSLATVEKQSGLAPLEIPVVVKQAAAPMTIQREARPSTVPQAVAPVTIQREAGPATVPQVAAPVTIQRAVPPTMVQGSTASAHVACQRQTLSPSPSAGSLLQRPFTAPTVQAPVQVRVDRSTPCQSAHQFFSPGPVQAATMSSIPVRCVPPAAPLQPGWQTPGVHYPSAMQAQQGPMMSHSMMPGVGVVPMMAPGFGQAPMPISQSSRQEQLPPPESEKPRKSHMLKDLKNFAKEKLHMG